MKTKKQIWRENLSVSEVGGIDALFSHSGLLIAVGHNRVVIGDRGPYVELFPSNIMLHNLYIPVEFQYRLTDKRVYYVEYRSKCNSFLKVYFQKRTVKYADYQIDMYYISPNDLTL